MKLLLTAISGAYEGRSFTIDPNQCVTFGRTNASMNSFEDDGHMSSLHFEVQNFGTHAEVRDLGSTNGTWLNNQKILTEQLREGDRLRAGKTVLTVEFVKSPGAEPISMQPARLVDSATFVPAGGSCDASPAVRPPSGYTTPPVSARRSATAQPVPHEPPSYVEPAPFVDPPRQPVDREPIPPRRPAEDPRRRLTEDTRGRPINPFDSFDFQQPPIIEESHDLEAAPSAADSSSQQPRSVSNPFDESSFSFSIPTVVPKDTAKSVGSFAFLAKRTNVDAADGLAIVLDSLAHRWSIQLVVHFQKIRSAPPGNCPGKPLFPWMPAAIAMEYSPIRLSWSDLQADPSFLALLPRLCRADACIAFLGDSMIEVGKQVDAMHQLGMEPFSEPGGILPTFWPSSLANILDVHGKKGCVQLFGHAIAGALCCSAWHSSYLLATAAPELADTLQQSGFMLTQSMSQSSQLGN